MKENTHLVEVLLEGIEKHYSKSQKILKYLSVVIVGLTFCGLIWLNLDYAKSDNLDNAGYLMSSFLFFFLIVAMFGIGLFSIGKQKNKNKRELQYFIDNPDILVSYQIVTGENTKLILKRNNKKVSLYIDLSPVQIEDTMFEIFPHLRKDNRHQETENEDIDEAKVPRTDQADLMENIPPVLKQYFVDEYKQKLGCLPFIFGILSITILLSIIGHFGWYNVWIFGVGNSYWGYLILPFLAFGYVVFIAESDEKKIYTLINNPENVIWVYLEKNKGRTFGIRTTSTSLVIADEKQRYHIPLFEQEEETLFWMSQYCTSAVVGFYYEWDKIYNENPKEFLNLIQNKKS